MHIIIVYNSSSIPIAKVGVAIKFNIIAGAVNCLWSFLLPI
jgi:hypothetical protein